MLDRLSVALYCAYSNVKIRLMRLAKEESGMETLEIVILVAVAVIIAAVLVNFLTSDGFTNPTNQQPCGLIEYIFGWISTKLDTLFDTASSST